MLALGRQSRTEQSPVPPGLHSPGCLVPRLASPHHCLVPASCSVLSGVGWGPVLSLCSSCPSFPAVRSFEVPEDFEECLEQQHIGPTTQSLAQADFPLQAYEPKVQVPFLVLPGQCPRKIEIERYETGGSGRAGPPGGGSAQLRGEGQQATSDHPHSRGYETGSVCKCSNQTL